MRRGNITIGRKIKMAMALTYQEIAPQIPLPVT